MLTSVLPITHLRTTVNSAAVAGKTVKGAKIPSAQLSVICSLGPPAPEPSMIILVTAMNRNGIEHSAHKILLKAIRDIHSVMRYKPPIAPLNSNSLPPVCLAHTAYLNYTLFDPDFSSAQVYDSGSMSRQTWRRVHILES
ncbi:hypothetical protein D3C75_777530 [compost metagenome]